MDVLIPVRAYRPNVDFRNPSELLTLDKGKRRMRFLYKVEKTVTMYVTFPKDGGVRIYNGKSGMFEPEEYADIIYEELGENKFKMTGNGTSVIFSYGMKKWEEYWNIEIIGHNGRQKSIISATVGRWTYSNFKIGRTIDLEHGLTYVEIPIEEGEEFYGTGERFNSFGQNGKKILMWNTDIGTVGNPLDNEYCDKPQGYKNVPIVHSTNGYSLFFNTHLPIEFDFGSMDPHKFITEIYGEDLDLFVWTGTVRGNIRNYHRLTGKPFVPPKWAFDFWLGGGWPVWNTPDSSGAFERISEALDKYKEYGMKVENAYLETDPTEKTLGGLRDRGVRTFMWTNSYLDTFGESKLDYDLYRVKKASDPKSVMNSGYIDFTAPESIDIINQKFEEPWNLGVCGEMIDYADAMPEDSLCRNGKTGTEMHNQYAYWYARRMNEAFTGRMGKDFVLFQRAGCAGSQHYAASFGGDIISSFLGFRRNIYEILSASSSGISIWGSDMGGFFPGELAPGTPEMEELFIRWIQFSAFSPLMREHSWEGHHQPWNVGKTAGVVLKDYYTRRLTFLDAIYSAALQSATEGGTVVESMAVAYGLSPSIDTQYIFCDTFLARPITQLGQRSADVILPEDGYCDLYTGKYYPAGTYEVDAPLEKMPIFIKPGSVIPYNLYGPNVNAGCEKENYKEAFIVTQPVYKCEHHVYKDHDRTVYKNEPMEDGFVITTDGSSRKTIILYEIEAKDIFSDAEIEKWEHEDASTVIILKSDWNCIKVKVTE